MLPLSINPREGWHPGLRGQAAAALRNEFSEPKNVHNSVIRGVRGFRPEVSASSDGRAVVYSPEALLRRGHGHDSSSHTAPSSSSHSQGGGRSRTRRLQSRASSSFISSIHTLTSPENNTVGEAEKEEEDVEMDGGSESEDDLTLGDMDPDVEGGSGEGSVSQESSGLSSMRASSLASLLGGGGVGLPPSSHATVTTSTESQHHLHLEDDVDDDIVIDCHDMVKHIGETNARQRHGLGLRSVYEAYSCGGEPLYTETGSASSTASGVKCSDYIFYSGFTLRARRFLTIPSLASLQGDCPLESMCALDPYSATCPNVFSEMYGYTYRLKDSLGLLGGSINDKKDTKMPSSMRPQVENIKKQIGIAANQMKSADFWAGDWVPLLKISQKRQHNWLPNLSFPSRHMALAAEFEIIKETVSSEWT